jgi:hypothetical protein
MGSHLIRNYLNIDIQNMNNKTLGFIILRNVNNEITNKYWNDSYDCVRKYYPENQTITILV